MEQARTAESEVLTTCFLFTLFLAGIPTASLFAQGDPCLNRTVTVTVATEKGQVVRGLGMSNFKAKFRGKAVDVSSVEYEMGPRRVVIVLDASGSMREKWPIEVTVAEALFTAPAPQNDFALLTFSNQVEDRVNFEQKSKSVADALAKLEVKDWTLRKGQTGKTALLDALVTALNMLRPARVGDAVYVITDGGDNASHIRPSGVKSLLLASGVRLFGLIPIENFSLRGRTPEEFAGPDELRKLVEESGGDVLTFVPGGNALVQSYVPRPLHLTDADREVMSFAAYGFGREISQFYRLQIKLPELVDKAREWTLEVVDPQTKKGPRLRVMYPHTLSPCQ